MQKAIRTIEGKFANADGVFYGRVEIDKKSGLIKKIGEPLGEADLIVEKGLIFPGFVDLHIHAREDASGRETYKEDFESASQAALHGGVICAADMPNNPVAPVDDKTYLAKKELAKDKPIDFLLYAGIGPNTKPLSFSVPYKVFMGPSVGDLYFENFSQLEKAIAKYKGCAVSFHAENPKMISETQRPPEAETSAIEFALYLIEKYALQGNICHCSTKEGSELIRSAKRKGISVTCEVTPHHLYFEESTMRVNPPIRTNKDRLALLEALRDGIIDYLASDHAPHSKEEKQKGPPSGGAGMPHLDTYGLFTTWLMKEHNFSAQDIARVCAHNPRKFVNQFQNIQDASFTVLDPDFPTLVKKEDLQTKCGWSPFEGVEFPGKVLYTIHKGNILYEA